MPPTHPSPPPETLHLPFAAGPYRMAMGLVACPPSELIELDDRYAIEMAERRKLLACRHGEVFAACPGTGPARAEVLALLAAHLPARYPEWFHRDGDRLHNLLTGEEWDLTDPAHEPLALAGRLVQEDLCIIRPAPDGPVLDAAVLCAPSRWRLDEKIGRKLLAVHDRVPFYAERLGAPVDRFMHQIKPGRVAMRLNWSILDDPALFQTGGKYRLDADASFTPDNVANRLFLRVERQTLSRLPQSGAVLFTIRVHSYALARVAAVPGAAAALASAVRALPEEMGAYKSLPVFQAVLLQYLDAAG